MAASDDDMQRLVTVIERQRRELDRIRAAAARESVVAMARGVLMERLGLSRADAGSQLAELAGATGVTLAEMAAAVVSPAHAADADASAEADSPGSGDLPRLLGQPSSPLAADAEAEAELAADGAELAGTMAAQLAPLGATGRGWPPGDR